MAITTSKIFSVFIQDALNRTSAYDLNADAFKVALYGDGATPDQTVSSANTAYAVGQWVVGNEKSNGGWAAGGNSLASVTSAFSSNVYTFDAADTANGSAATLSAVTGCLVYDSTVSNLGLSFHYFGGSQSVTAGTLTVVWNASGIISITV